MSKTATNSKCHGLRTKTPLDILNAKIADKYAGVGGEIISRHTVIVIPLWVAEELKQALEKQ